MSGLTDHYAVLEVTPAATDEEIEAAYRRLIRAWHPDNYPVDAPREIHEFAEERTKLLIQARQELRDPERRRAFDERRRAVVNENGRPAPEAKAAPPAPDEVVSGASSAAATPPAGGADGVGDAPTQAPHGFSNARLIVWLALAGLMAVVAFASTAVVVDIPARTDEAYHYAPSIFTIVFTALMLGLLVWIAPGIRVRDVLAFRPVRSGARDVLGLHMPRAWRWALGVGGAIVVGSYAFVLLFLTVFGLEGDEALPTFWDGSRVPQFALSLLVIAVVVPIFEELMYRGVGYGLLERFGTTTAIVSTALLFGLAHGSLALLPVFAGIGIALGWLRSRTGSIYPGVVVHGVYNSAVMLLAVAFG